MALFHTKVGLRGFHFEDFHLTFTLAAGIVAADAGKAVSLDTSAPNKVKLAGDGDTIVGRLATVEDRKVEGQLVGAVALKFANTLPIKAGQVVAVGDTVVGAGGGEVKKATAADPSKNFVGEIIGSEAVVVLI
ncbi:hypothetical protein [Rhizobium sp. Leaf383]|uniref:hypothetical protein n=1 Tax=Rhizobium sp. Leaf383 TaxID=1736357 RepID=UPI0007136927|nr:hypothetical protein [Rhizobium sp. Leaf383]KQS84262.1 hypothetical protein ASG58_21060 [Rhizobium sp. Leaf383]